MNIMFIPTTQHTLAREISLLSKQLWKDYSQASINKIYREHIQKQHHNRHIYYSRKSAIKKLQAIYLSLYKELHPNE